MLLADLQRAIPQLVALGRETSAIILSFYQHPDLQVERKADHTPLTQADLAAHHHLNAHLPRIIDAPVISEEGDKALCPEVYWLIDPIDGTKSFVEHTGQFCICIALIRNHRPILSLIYAPLSDEYWYALAGGGSFYGATKRLICRPHQAPLTITAAAFPNQLSKRMQALSALLYGEPFYHLSQQSALKYCRIASAEADLYLKPSSKSSEWDIAAGDLLLQEAGGGILWIDSQSALLSTPQYGARPSFTNPPFIAFGAGFERAQLERLAEKILELTS